MWPIAALIKFNSVNKNICFLSPLVPQLPPVSFKDGQDYTALKYQQFINNYLQYGGWSKLELLVQIGRQELYLKRLLAFGSSAGTNLLCNHGWSISAPFQNRCSKNLNWYTGRHSECAQMIFSAFFMFKSGGFVKETNVCSISSTFSHHFTVFFVFFFKWPCC